mmetsp:Transcript_15960/g.33379  ORF Transcript_15960/g.33379 Transcript_15960/m.33379 type:complete len:303 (+) Transcript_15960:68-976(+)
MQTEEINNETPWVDAWIRWERNSKDLYPDEGNEEANEPDEDYADIPPPTESFTFTYPNPNNSSSSEGNDDKEANESNITLNLKGFHSDSEQTWTSTGLTLWKSSHHLCQYLVDKADTLLCPPGPNDSLRILEVGSGLGRCGILAHHLSHDNATTILTDGDTDTLKQLRDNVQRNVTGEECGNQVFCRQLLWGEKFANQFLREQQQQQQQKGDDKAVEEKRFDVILGSDLLYVQSVIRPLFETVRVLLNDKGHSKFVMAHCSRRIGNEVDLSMVLDVANDEGFTYEEVFEEEDISVLSFQITP